MKFVNKLKPIQVIVGGYVVLTLLAALLLYLPFRENLGNL